MLGAFTDLNEASSLTYANDMIDIYSNSWGPCDEGCVDGPMRLTELALKTGAERVRGIMCRLECQLSSGFYFTCAQYTYTHALMHMHIWIAYVRGVTLGRYFQVQKMNGGIGVYNCCSMV